MGGISQALCLLDTVTTGALPEQKPAPPGVCVASGMPAHARA